SVRATSPPEVDSAPTLLTNSEQVGSQPSTPTSSPTTSALPTSTPWPTIDPTAYPTYYVTPTRPVTPTPNYYAQMKELYRPMIGEWWGKMGVSVKGQGRKAQYAVIVFYPQCEMGQVCGHYHFDSGCFGELVLSNWRPTFLVFRNLEYSGKSSCSAWRPMNVSPLSRDRLSFTYSHRNEKGEWVSKGVILKRR
ncbi:MAG: hypothetical protein RML93_12785, partial [Anaerolineales bacterium]|nr:hypothetical protein [Anaerolineales bacterium]MDW8448151.1 hypothetical protein [Anaerolineales bacterium]